MPTAFDQTLDAIDALHAEDPRSTTLADGTSMPQELAYAQRMSDWLNRVHDAPDEVLRLAVRAQHLQRWLVPRAEYPEGRVGYLTWRRDQGKRAGDTTAQLMREAGYSDADAEQAKAMINKKGLGRDPAVQALEDSACLVFLENYFADFSRKIDHDHMVRIVQMTWRKMSPRAHELALTLPMSETSTALVKEALGVE
ncbi:DUF4202 domain-containing protein [Vreelandella sulfidaeris]|uniref:DUF4202 domain-containing protein n=1 Tax=Vreelandella sulfidaeris TaxID=115553 RepID=UPI0035E57CB0|tara:strand:+ start:164 stop:754 length:591 start_codon:yes stop_codon:yes gene_type:complete